MVFKLGATAKAPEFAVPQQQPPIDLANVSSTGNVERGFELFNRNCQVCHGPNATGAWLPDLKRSPMLLTAADWKGVVIDGASASRGMASFARFLNAKDAEDIRAFVIDEAKKAQSGGQAAAVPIG